MKKFLSLLTLVAISLGFSSCCSMFGIGSQTAGYRTETSQVKTRHFDTVTEEIHTGGKEGMVQLVEKKVPRYKTVTKKVRIPCQRCTRFYCPKKDCCGTTSESTIKMATASEAMLVPTMMGLAAVS